MKQLVIVGGGIAGITAAKKARSLHSPEELAITILTEERPPCYYRPGLIELLAGQIKKEDMAFPREEWFKTQQINLRYPVQVTKIIPFDKTIRFTDLSSSKNYLTYDALILATGSRAYAPIIPDVHSPAAGSVFTLRTMVDVENIRQHIAIDRRKAAILGGGLLGLEIARSLKSTGVEEVHVMESSGYLLNRQLNRTASEMLRMYLEKQEALHIHTGVQVDINELKNHRVAEVLRSICGEGVETLVYSVGVRSQFQLAQEAGLICNRGIVVDNTLATSDKNIFAAGDCAEFQGVIWGIIPAALEQGEKAGEFACWMLFSPESSLNAQEESGKEAPDFYQQTVPHTAITIGKRKAFSVGKAVLTAEEENSGNWKNHESLPSGKRRKNFQEEVYVNLVEDCVSGLIVGGLVFGPTKESDTWIPKLKGLEGKKWLQEREKLENQFS